MLGNAAEWIADCYDPIAYQHNDRLNPRGPVIPTACHTLRVARSPAWPELCIVPSGISNEQINDQLRNSTGFRCVQYTSLDESLQ